MKSLSMRCILVACLVLIAAPLAAADLQILTLLPTDDGWTAILEGKATKKAGDLTFWADGEELAADLESTGKNQITANLQGVKNGIQRLAVGTTGKKGAKELAALRVGTIDPATSFGDWTIYHIMMGYFQNSNKANDGVLSGWKHTNYAGGDLQGVLEKVDYIASLGVTAVWLSPIFQTQSSHGYDVLDYYRIGDSVAVPDNIGASLHLFRQVRDALQAKGIRVILDVPLNHASRAYDLDHGDPKKRKPRATAARQEAEKTWESWGANFRYWNFGHEPTRQFLTETALYWLVDENVDGLRLDYVRGVEHEYWAELHAAVRAKKPNAYLVGEAWIDGSGADANARDTALYYAPVDGQRQFQSLLDFPIQITATEVFGRRGSASDLEAWLQSGLAFYGPGAEPTYFLDNHDLTRFLSWGAKDERLVAALGFLASLSSPMVMFYGSETGLTNGSPKPGFTDSSRVVMPWNTLNQTMVDQVSEIFNVRQKHPALTHGGRFPLQVDDRTLVMAKVHDEEVVLVGVNLNDKPVTVELDLPTGWRGAYSALIGGSQVPSEKDGKVVWTLGADSTSWVGLGL